MSRTRDRNRIGTALLRLLVGTLFAAGLLGATVAASAAEGMPGMTGMPGMPGGNVQPPTPLEVCLAVFPDGIIVGDPIVGDIDCSLIFGSGPPPQEPTEVPTQEPSEEPTQEPSEVPTQKPTDVATETTDHDHAAKHDHDNTPEASTGNVGGKAAPTVTTMPNTGHAMAGSSTGTATIFAVLALVLAALASVTLRLSDARNPRR